MVAASDFGRAGAESAPQEAAFRRGGSRRSPLRHPLKLRAQRLQSAVSGCRQSAAAGTVAVPDSTSAAPNTACGRRRRFWLPSARKIPEAAVRMRPIAEDNVARANPATVAMRCRQDEVEAWTRLTVQNEFPTLDETSRRKCNEAAVPGQFCGSGKLARSINCILTRDVGWMS